MSISLRRAAVALAAVAALSACASAPATRGAPDDRDVTVRGARRAANNQSVLTREDLAAAGSTNLFDVVTALRPRWLENPKVGNIPTQGSRGYGRAAGVAVYVNGQLYGDVSSLASVQKELVERMTYLSIAEAQQRYAIGQFQPVIDIRLVGSRGR